MEKVNKSSKFVNVKRKDILDEINFDELVELSGDVQVDLENDILIEEVEETPTLEKDSAPIEDEQESEEEVTQEETEEYESQEETESYRLLKSLIDLGQIEDYIVTIDDKEVQLSEFKSLDEDTLKDVLNTYKEEQKNQINSEYVKVKDLDDTKKALIDIVIKGDYDQVKELFKNPETFKDPFEGFDNNNENHNTQIYYTYLTKVQNHSEDEAKALLDISKNNHTLDQKALKIVEAHREDFKKSVEAEKQRVEQVEKDKKERIKTYSKELEQELSGFGLRPEKVLELKKVSTQFDKFGNLPVDGAYEEAMKDPKTAADLVLFLTDRKLYNERIFAEAKKQSDVETVKKIQLVRSSSSKKKVEEQQQNKNNDVNPFKGLIIED